MSPLPKPLPDTPAELRAQIVQIAASWLKTPWHHEARLKGAGVDCAQFLLAVYAEAGLITDYTPDRYPQDWYLHRDEPLFMREIEKHCNPVAQGLVGDIVMFKFGRAPAHGAILMEPNIVIHAYRPEGRVTLSEIAGSPLADKIVGYYRWKGFSA